MSNAKKSPTALDPKTPVCKELECTGKAQVNGFCRLHFLKLVKSRADEDSAELNPKASSRDRRRGNRLLGLDGNDLDGSDSQPDQLVESYGNLDTDINSLLDSDEIAPFKKAG